MKTSYLGFTLDSPVVVGSSPYTATISRIERCAAHGAGAVVLKSVFEEQIMRRAQQFGYETSYADSERYLQQFLGQDYLEKYLEMIAEARIRTRIPIIASINCFSKGDSWAAFASRMQQAGASAIELNIFTSPGNVGRTSAQIEQTYMEIVRTVATTVTIPVSVKLTPHFTNILAAVNGIYAAGARGAVLFNRLLQPDIDIDREKLVPEDPYSRPAELRSILYPIARCSAAVPQIGIAASTAILDGRSAVKAILCGASVVQICSAIRDRGYEAIDEIDGFIDRWAADRDYASIDLFRGKLNFRNTADPEIYDRRQYMRYYAETPQ